MPSAEDPSRLLDDAGESADLRRGLERMTRDLPDAEVMARLAARLGIAEPPAAPPKGLRGTALKLAAGAGVVGLGLFGAVHATRVASPPASIAQRSAGAALATTSDETGAVLAPSAKRGQGQGTALATERQDKPAPSSAVSPSASAVVPLVLPGAMAQNGAPSSPEPSAETTERRLESTRPRSSPGRASEANGSSAPSNPPLAGAPSETELLRDARLVLARDPSQALALSEQHRRLYPGGAFSQEREVIAITALARLGRTSEASARADRFERAYPTSPYRQRIDAALSR